MSTSIQNTQLLDQPVDRLPVSVEFKQMMRGLEFATLRNLLQHPAHQLLKMEGFGYRMLKELITLLEKNGLTDWLQE